MSRREGMGMMTMMVLYAGSMMTSLMAALISCDTLSGEIASGTIHAIATKPVQSLVPGARQVDRASSECSHCMCCSSRAAPS